MKEFFVLFRLVPSNRARDLALAAIVLMWIEYGKNAFGCLQTTDNKTRSDLLTNGQNGTDNLMVGRRYNYNYMFFFYFFLQNA